MIDQPTTEAEAEETEELDGAELLRKWQEQNKAWHFEGDSGCEKMERLVETLGYRNTGFRFGSPIESFLSDNPGAMEAILGFIEEHLDQNSEWRENVESDLEDDDVCDCGHKVNSPKCEAASHD